MACPHQQFVSWPNQSQPTARLLTISHQASNCDHTICNADIWQIKDAFNLAGQPLNSRDYHMTPREVLDCLLNVVNICIRTNKKEQIKHWHSMTKALRKKTSKTAKARLYDFVWYQSDTVCSLYSIYWYGSKQWCDFDRLQCRFGSTFHYVT